MFSNKEDVKARSKSLPGDAIENCKKKRSISNPSVSASYLIKNGIDMDIKDFGCYPPKDFGCYPPKDFVSSYTLFKTKSNVQLRVEVGIQSEQESQEQPVLP